MQKTRVLAETRGTTGEESISHWFDLPIDVAEFEEKLGVGAESQDYRITEKVLPFADEVHEHTSCLLYTSIMLASTIKTISLPKLLVHGLQRQPLKQTATEQPTTSQN